MEHDLLQKNYSDFVKLRDKDPGTKRTAIPAEDRAKIWAAIDAGNHDAEIAMILMYTGMRPSELLLIEKANVDLDARIMIGGLKTEAGQNRHIPIHKCIEPFVRRLMETDGEYLIMRYDKGKPQEMTYSRFSVYHWNPLMKQMQATICARPMTCSSLPVSLSSSTPAFTWRSQRDTSESSKVRAV